jgi:hypothetical protein
VLVTGSLDEVRRQVWTTCVAPGQKAVTMGINAARHTLWKGPEDLTDRQAAKLADIASHGKPLHRGPQGVDLRGGGPQIQHRPSGERRQPPAATVAPWQDIRPLRVCPASAACRTDRSNRGDAERSSCEVATPCPERRPAVESSQPMDGVGEHGWGRV